MFRSWNEFLAWEKATKDTIDFKTIYVDVVGKKGVIGDKNGDIISGLLLSQIVYWYLPSKNGGSKLTQEKNGHYWIVKPAAEWYDEIRLTPANYRTAIAKLEAEKLIIKDVFKDPFDPKDQKNATFIRLNIPEFMRRLDMLLAERTNEITTPDQNFEDYFAEQIKLETLSHKGIVESTISEIVESTISENVESTISIESVESTISENVESHISPITKNTLSKNTFSENTLTKSLLNSSSLDSNNTRYIEAQTKSEDDDEKGINPIVKPLLIELGYKKPQLNKILQLLRQRGMYWVGLKNIQNQHNRIVKAQRNGSITKLPEYFVDGLEMFATADSLDLGRKQEDIAIQAPESVPFYNWLEK